MTEENTYYFIVNPASDTGRLKKKWPKVLEHIQENYNVKFDWSFTEGRLMADKLLLKAVNEGYNNIIAVGGDGIANELINAVMKNGFASKVVIGLLGMGTVNEIHLAYTMRLDYKEALKILLGGNVIRAPIGKITGDFNSSPQYIFNHADTGLSSLAAKSAYYGIKWLKGEIKYYIYALANIIKFKENTGSIKLDGEYVLNSAGEKYDHFSVIAWAFGSHLGGFNLFPENNMQKEGFAVLLGGYKSRFALLKLLIQADSGKHIGKPNIVYTRAKKIEIELENSWPYEAEGEIFTEDSKTIKVEYVKDAIDMIVPNGFTVF